MRTGWSQEALDYQWAVVLAHEFGPAQRLGGTHSRDYDRLTGHGPLDLWVDRLDHPGRDLGSTRSNLASVEPTFDPSIFRLGPAQTSVIRWDDRSWATWSRGKAWGLGSATENYYNMDKTPFVLDLASDPRTPVINFWMDGRGDYDGLGLVLESSGHLKSLHLRPALAAAQRDGEVVFVAAGTSEGQDRLDSTISLPASARYWLDGEELQPFHHQSLWQPDPAPAPPGTEITVTGDLDHPQLVVRDDDPQRGVGVERTLPAVPGTRYRTWIQGSGDLSLYHNYYDSWGRLIGGEHILAAHLGSGRSAWQETVAPADAASLKVWLYSSIKAVGEFRLTDVRVEEGTAPATLVASFD